VRRPRDYLEIRQDELAGFRRGCAAGSRSLDLTDAKPKLLVGRPQRRSAFVTKLRANVARAPRDPRRRYRLDLVGRRSECASRHIGRCPRAGRSVAETRRRRAAL